MIVNPNVFGLVDQVPGPYEFEGSLFAVLQFIFTAGILIGKVRPIQITSSFLCAGASGAAVVYYYLNQTLVGNTLANGPLFFFASGVLYGTVIGVLMLRAVFRQKRLERETAEKIANLQNQKRRFED